jgi:Ni/Co efflux regulator RcnB
MKRLLVIAAAMSLMLPALAMAQNPPPKHGEHGKPGGGMHGKPGGGMHGKPGGGMHGKPGGGMHGKPGGRPGHPGTRPGHPGTRPGHPGTRPPHHGRPNNGHRGEFRHRGRYYKRIHGPRFIYPPGWGYRRWSIGVIFPPIFLSPTYFYNGWGALGLQAPAPGYAWVRYGPDLVLVNLSTREVEDVVYGVFE